MRKDWLILGIQLIAVFVPTLILFYLLSYAPMAGYFFLPSSISLGYLYIVFVVMFVNLLLSGLMISIFFKEAKNYSSKASLQTMVFGFSLVPLILMMNWLIALLLPQLVYLFYDRYSWKKVKEEKDKGFRTRYPGQ
jgi:hypothetical protein